ncbi:MULTISPECIES: hypothetical protein [Thalassospira]|uniref:Uncharacterized protein n=2 Tax=Thalassospira TaxID=168934 RepID=A0A367W5Q5_9PROT|nr:MULTISPECIES: hypothetical protein [Thalassospira]MDG4718346.1 hypothetical protein [Thalassospira sp. FZY0004]RCK34730.1 hypothetical protein TH19_16000 [Thalassospira profundimaris]
MIAANKPPRDSFKQRHHVAAFTVLEQFSQGLIHFARNHGGAITEEQILKAIDGLREKEDLFDAAWAVLESDLESIKAREHAAVRHDPFGRLLVSRFDHLLEGSTAGDIEHGALPRSILQPFFKVIRMMVGMDMLQEIDREIHEIIEAHADEDDELRDPAEYWDHLAKEPAVKLRINLVFARMALHFRDYEHRKKWLLQLVNDNLPAGDVPWTFTEAHCVRLLDALFGDVREILTVPEQSAELVAKMGSEDVASLREVMKSIDADIARHAAA